VFAAERDLGFTNNRATPKPLAFVSELVVHQVQSVFLGPRPLKTIFSAETGVVSFDFVPVVLVVENHFDLFVLRLVSCLLDHLEDKEKVLTSTVCSCDDFGTYLDFHLALP
jgi:hypothetical protein